MDEAIDNTYILEGGGSFTLDDPMLMQGIILTNNLATFSAALTGTGAELTLTLTASTNGGSEAFAFQNLVVTGGGEPPPPPPPGIAFDMVDSGNLNLNSFTNPFDGAFGAA